jgi:hypothetical protein
MLKNDKMILVFGLSAEEREALSKDELLSRIDVTNITREMTAMTIKDIVSGLKFEVYEEALPEERVVLFNNFTDEELEMAIKAVRALLKPGIIMAIVTQTSIEWTFKYLLKHLIEEREWYKAQKRGTQSE